MLKVNQVVLVDNPAPVLDEESGVLEVVSPLGDVIRVTCSRGQMHDHQHVGFRPEKKRADRMWEITKVAELPAEEEPEPRHAQNPEG